jgi:hypothetical protein
MRQTDASAIPVRGFLIAWLATLGHNFGSGMQTKESLR